MARKKKAGFMDLMTGPATLVPIFLGVGAAIYFWATEKPGSNHKLSLFLAAVGFLGGLGTLLTLWTLQPGLKPALVKRRQELLGSLQSLLSQESGGATRESPQLAMEAPVERM